MVLFNDIDLIGDFLGTIPATLVLKARYPKLMVVPKQKIIELHHFYADSHKIPLIVEYQAEILKQESRRFDLHGAFKLASEHNLHMTQAHFSFVGLLPPAKPIRPDIAFPDVEVPQYDILFAPYSKSLPPHEKWQEYNWIELARKLSDYKVGVLGSATDPKFILEPNVDNYFGNPYVNMFNAIKKAKVVVSVVSGPSHICYAVNTPNVLMDSQGAWGVNPDSHRIHAREVHSITVDQVYSKTMDVLK